MKTLHGQLVVGAAFTIALLASTAADAQKYRFPIKPKSGWSRYVTNYYDHGNGSTLRDYACGSKTYRGHGGTDIGTGGWAGMDAGQDIVAAAPGVVVTVNDGCFDRCASWSGCTCSSTFGNYVAIKHADGKRTYYAHMKKNSVAVSVGQRVSCGQKLGQVGSSGLSTGPHLHFEVRYADNTKDDPYRGSCGGPITFWVNQGSYQGVPGTTCDGASAPTPPPPSNPPPPSPPPPPPPPPPPSCSEVTRIAGASRYATAANVSKSTFPNGASVVIIASGVDGNTDAIVAGPLARHEGGPLLLTQQGALPSATRAEIERLGATRAIIVGGPVTVSNAVVTALEDLGLSVSRVDGTNRYDTSANVARLIGNSAGYAFVASGEDSGAADAVAAAAAAAALEVPLLLVKSNSVPSQVVSALSELGITQTYLAGGVLTVSSAVEQALPGAIRLSGSNRYATSVEVAEAARVLGASAWRVFLTRGDMTTDAVTVGATGRLLVLSRTDSLPSQGRTFLSYHASRATLVGGTMSLNDDVHRAACAAFD